MGRTVPTKQIEKYKNSRRKAKRTMNRQRNSWISVKGCTFCCTDPGFVSQIGVHLVSEKGWTVVLWRQSCTEHFITPRGRCMHFPPLPHVTRLCVFLLFIIPFSCGTIQSRIPAEYELHLTFYSHSALSGFLDWLQFWPFYVAFARSLHICVGFFPGTLVQLVLMDLCVLW